MWGIKEKNPIGLLVFALLLVLTILGVSYSVFLYRALKNRNVNETLASDSALARMGSKFVADHQSAILSRLVAIASRPLFQAAVSHKRLDQLMEFLGPLLSSREELQGVCLADAKKRLLMVLPESGAATRCQFRQRSNAPRPGVSNVHQVLSSPAERVVTLSAPVFDQRGLLVGYLGVNQGVAYWQHYFKRLSARPGRSFLLFDRNGRQVASATGSVSPARRSHILIARHANRLMLKGRKPLNRLINIGLPDGRAFTAAVSVPDLGWSMVLVHGFDEALAGTRSMFQQLVLLFLLLLAGLTTLGLVLLSRYRQQQNALTKLDHQAKQLESEVAERNADLSHSRERYQTLVQGVPDMVYEVDARGHYIFVSQAVERVLGYRPQEMLGRTLRDFMVEADYHLFDQEQEVIEQGKELSIVAIRCRHADGSLRWLSLHSRGLFDREGRLWGRLGVARDISKQVLAERQVYELSSRLIASQEEERKRIALDLHDEMGQMLSALKMGLQGSLPKTTPIMQRELKKHIELTQSVMDRIRALAYNLRPAILDNFGLRPALQDLCDTLNASGLIKVEHQIGEFEEKLMTPQVKISLFRFVQEALTNAVRHSGSYSVRVSLDKDGDSLQAVVRDFGRGFDIEAGLERGKQLGLMGMRERFNLLGGRLTIESSSQGTILRAEAPLTGGENGPE